MACMTKSIRYLYSIFVPLATQQENYELQGAIGTRSQLSTVMSRITASSYQSEILVNFSKFFVRIDA